MPQLIGSDLVDTAYEYFQVEAFQTSESFTAVNLMLNPQNINQITVGPLGLEAELGWGLPSKTPA